MTAAAAAATAPTTDHVLIASLCPPHLWWRVPFLCTPLPPAPRPRNHFRAMREALGRALRDEENREGNLGQLLDFLCTYPRRRISTVEP
jgi:hypothetical protein